MRAVHGVVEAPPTPEDGTPFAAMVSGVECVYCRATVTKVMPDGQVQTYTEEHGINFVVTDDTGSVMVRSQSWIQVASESAIATGQHYGRW